MANKLYEESHIQAIANAIREKNGTSNSYLVSEMSDAILAIESDGSESVGTLVDSGQCGENANWSFFSDGTLIISGQGMADFDNIADCNDGNGPKGQVVKIIINDGINAVASAFLDMTSLESIVIPNTLDTIHNYTFDSADKLVAVYYKGSKEEWNKMNVGNNNDCLLNATFYCEYEESGSDDATLFDFLDGTITTFVIPSTLTSIRDGLFYGCTNLTSVTIPDGITRIGRSAFYLCGGLTKITVPNTVTTIDTYAFGQCTGITEYDFTSWTSVPKLANTNAFTGIQSSCKMKVPSALYSALTTATNWSTYKKYMVSV